MGMTNRALSLYCCPAGRKLCSI